MSQAWFPFYPAHYLADTGHLTTQEHGAYLLLMLHYYATGSLPTDELKLARIARLTASEWTTVRDTIADLFDENWQHFRIDAELATAQEKHEARATAGSRGGKRTWERRKQSSSIAEAMLKHLPQPQSSEPNGSDADASPRARLWEVGLPILETLGVPSKRARPMIGRWLQTCSDDFDRLRVLLEQAGTKCPADPISWITRCLTEKKHEEVSSGNDWRGRRDRQHDAKARFSEAVRKLEGGDDGDGPIIQLVPNAGRG